MAHEETYEIYQRIVIKKKKKKNGLEITCPHYTVVRSIRYQRSGEGWVQLGCAACTASEEHNGYLKSDSKA